jgi:hypothetical protein
LAYRAARDLGCVLFKPGVRSSRPKADISCGGPHVR